MNIMKKNSEASIAKRMSSVNRMGSAKRSSNANNAYNVVAQPKEQKKTVIPQYVRPKTANQSVKQKRLMSAVSQEQRVAANSNSSFIDNHKTFLKDVSSLNLKRACQIKDQFVEQRKLFNNKLMDHKKVEKELQQEKEANKVERNIGSAVLNGGKSTTNSIMRMGN